MTLIKQKTLFLLGAVLIVVVFSIGAYVLLQRGVQHVGDEEIGVVVTIPPQREFVESVGGDKVKVTVLVGPGANPHTYEPKPSQLAALAEAEMYVKVGSGVEFELAWMDKIISLNKDMLVVDCSDGVELLTLEGQGSPDPHIWLSPRNAKIMVENIYAGLVELDPANQQYYAQNKEEYLQELDRLDEDIVQSLSGVSNRKFLVYHPAWAYFARDYNLEQIPIEKEGKEPTPQGIANLVEQAKENGIKVIFASPEFNTASARVIANEIGGEVVLIDPLGENYLENMRQAGEALAEALAGGG